MKTKFTLSLLLFFCAILSVRSQKLNWHSSTAGNQQFTVQVSEHTWDMEATPNGVAVTGYITGEKAVFGGIMMADGSNNNFPDDMYNYLAYYDTNGKVLWVERLSRIYKADIALDAEHNIWVAFTDAFSSGFIRKYSPSGQLLLEKQIEISTNVELTSISIDQDQAIIVTGVLHSNRSTVTVEGKTYTGLNSSSVNVYPLEGFVMKYTKEMAPEWFALTKGTDTCVINDAQVDSQGNTILAGEFSTEANKPLQFGPDLKLSAHPLYSTSYTTGFVAKISSTGQFVWAHNLQATTDSWANGVALNAQDEIQVVGTFSGTATFNGSQLTSKGSNDVYLAKLSAAGNVLWLKSAGSSFATYGGGDYGRTVSSDSRGNIFIGGSYVNRATFGEGDRAVTLRTTGTYDRAGFVAQYTTDGDVVWAEAINGASGAKAEVLAVATADATLYAGGNFNQNVTLLGRALPVSYPNMDHVFVTSVDYSATITALPALEQENQLVTLHPNPTTGKLRLSVQQPAGRITSLQLFGATGTPFPLPAGTQADQVLDLSSLPAGLYHLMLQTDKYIIKKKIIKL